MIQLSASAFGGFLLVLFRATGMLIPLPVISSRAVPVQIRLAFAFVLSLAAWLGAGAPKVAMTSTDVLVLAVVSETLVGLAAGFVARVALDALLAAGNLAGMGMGMGFGGLLDPISGVTSSALAQLYAIAGLAFAVMLGIHREAAAWFAFSLRAFPPGTDLDWTRLLGAAVTQGIGSIVLAVRLSFPVVTAVIFGHLGLGLIGRLAPQLSLQSLGLSVSILTGGWAAYLSIPSAAAAAANAAVSALHTFR